MIDKDTILSLADTYKDFYLQQRNDSSRAEAYKREKLPVIHDEIFGAPSENKSLHDKLVYLDKNKQNRVDFRGNMSDLIRLYEKDSKRFEQLREDLFDESLGLAEKIDRWKEQCKALDTTAKIGSDLVGYLYATYNPGQYPLYKDSVFQRLKRELDRVDERKSFSIGEKYETFTEICTTIGEYLKDDLQDSPYGGDYTALDGQDFLYIVGTHQLEKQNNKLRNYIQEFKSNWSEWKSESDYDLTRKHYEFFQSFFTNNNLERIRKLGYESGWDDTNNQANEENPAWREIQKIGEHLFVLQRVDVKRRAFGKPNHTLNRYIDTFKTIADTNTPANEVYIEMSDKNSNLYLFGLGAGSLSEILGYVRADSCHLVTDKTKTVCKKILGMDIKPIRGKPYAKYGQWSEILDSIAEVYEETITDLPKNLEIDKLLAYLDANHLNDVTVQKRYRLIAPGPNAQHWEYFKSAGIIGIGRNNLGDLQDYKNKKSIGQKLQELEESSSSQRNNANACWEFAQTMEVGDIVIAKQGTTTYLGWGIVTGEYTYDDENDIYYNTRTVDWMKTGEREEPGNNIVLKTLTDITKYPDYVTKLKLLLGITDLSSESLLSMKPLQPHPLNQILYGVPGTGKTYSTVNYAVAIIENKSLEEIEDECKQDNGQGRSKVIQRYSTYKETGQIVFTTFHQSFGYEDFIEGLKATTSDEGDISYEVTPGVFKAIASKAKKNIEKSHLESKEDDEEYVSELVNNFATYVNQQLESGPYKLHGEVLIDSVRVGNDGSFKSFVTGGSVNKQSLTRNIILRDYKNFKQGNISSYKDIQPAYESKASYHGNAPYYYYLLEKLREFEQKHFSHIEKQDVAEEVKNYVLIIDEINRGNISKIFGELITLIESDKRLGNKEELTVTLPYSKESFGVPSNLYLLGTMNTADRSIALMDIALRRRFHFKELPPQSELLENITVEGIEIATLLDKINDRITMLYDKDHQIGHAYFMGIKTLQDLISVFKQKILPLLQEYFYDDWEKIQIVLGDHQKQNLKYDKDKIILENENQVSQTLGFNSDEIENDYTYEINQKLSPESFRGIYESTLTTDDQ